EDIAGKKMKSTNTWNYDGNGTNESGFSGLPCGTYDLPWGFQDLGTHAYWWSSTGLGVVDIDGECASIFTLSYSSNKIEQLRFNVSAVLSIRCVKD
ncbi:hypothetical protein KJ766_01925, partial [Patescibacteria group bacterium]|nr:hypothetical protein [Patescibacteria group bacterium]